MREAERGVPGWVPQNCGYRRQRSCLRESGASFAASQTLSSSKIAPETERSILPGKPSGLGSEGHSSAPFIIAASRVGQ